MLALRPFTVVLISVVLSLLPTFQNAGTTNVTLTNTWFTSSNNASGDNFGVRMNMSGETVVVGGIDDSHDSPFSGAAYVFVKVGAGWVQQQKLTATAPVTNQGFAASVAIEGNTIVVGAPGEDDETQPLAGAAYVFIRDGSNWLLQQKLRLPETRTGDAFGTAVGISGDSIVVTAPGDADNNFLSGTASVFTRDQNGVWSFQQKFRATDQILDQMYGASVAISGDTVMVGSEYLAPIHNAGIGAVYVYERVGAMWTLTKKLTSSTWRGGYEFGRFLAMDGNVAVISAYHEEHGSNTRGSLYVFVRDSGEWRQQQKLFVKEDLAEWDFFGVGVAIHGTTIVAGNNGADEQRGAAYIFTADNKLNWSQQTKLRASDGLIDEHFGTGVATNGSDVLVGATSKAISGPSCGAVYYSSLNAP